MEFCWNARPLATSTLTATQRRRKRQHASKITVNNVQERFCYLQQYQVLVCREHATGIQNVDAHLRDQHGVARKERKAIVDHCRRWRIAAPHDVELPPPLGPPIEELGEPLDVLQCRISSECGFCTANQSRMQKHCNNVHQASWSSKDATLCERVKAQTFFRAGGLQRYFVVKAAAAAAAAAADDDDEGANVVRARLADWELAKRAQEEKAQVMDAHVAKTDKTGWFKRTGWLEHFADRNLMHLAHQIRLPDRGEEKLRRAAKLTELLVERSVKGLSQGANETQP